MRVKGFNFDRYFVSVGISGFLLFLLCGLTVISILNRLNRQVVYLDRIDTPFANPLMGWAPWANLQNIDQPHTLVYADLTWRDFEPQEGVFDFEKFETEQQFSRWRREGKRVVFRFVLDVPRAESHLDIPDWLFEKINGDGEFYDNEYGMGFSPNYSNPELIKYHLLAIQALANRYNPDDFIAFIELGSFGHWGEWHVNSSLQQTTESVRDQYVQHYLDSFLDKYLLMRRPFTIAKTNNLGLYNDMTGSVEDTEIWLSWITNGGDYLPDEKNTLIAMPNAWQTAPIGGEQAPTLSDEYLYGSDLEGTLRLLNESHTSFIGPGGPYKLNYGGPLQIGLDRVISTIGYRLYVESAELPISVYFGDYIDIKLNISNAGIAPFYFDWDTYLYLLDENGNQVEKYPLLLDLRSVLPGYHASVPYKIKTEYLKNQKYIVGIAIIDPATGLPGVRFANQSTRQDLIQEIGSFEVKKILVSD